jgi:hypothetical protein
MQKTHAPEEDDKPWQMQNISRTTVEVWIYDPTASELMYNDMSINNYRFCDIMFYVLSNETFFDRMIECLG